MKSSWFTGLLCALAVAAGSLLLTGTFTTTKAADNTLTLAMALSGPLDISQPANQSIRPVGHDLCGIGLGGKCPRRYRGCRKAGRPEAECKKRDETCSACAQAMVTCRQKVGHQQGYTCAKCRETLDACWN